MVVFNFLSYKIPQWLQKHEKKKQHIKEKKYAQPKQSGGMMGNMNMMMYMEYGDDRHPGILMAVSDVLLLAGILCIPCRAEPCRSQILYQ